MKVLICAQPKSASTSLMESLGEICGMSFGQQFYVREDRANLRQRRLMGRMNRMIGLFDKRRGISFHHLDQKSLRACYPASHYGISARFHTDIADFTDAAANDVIFAFDLHKQHFPPTAGNLSLFRQTPKIVLTRDVEQTLIPIHASRQAP